MRRSPILLAVGVLAAASFAIAAEVVSEREPRQPTVTLRPAQKIEMPHREVDCNSPSHWDGDMFYVFNSTGHPFRSFGKGLDQLGSAEAVKFDNKVNGGRWLEATWLADDGTLYGWYHLEPAGLCPGSTLTAPKIGALRSTDQGATWKDRGIVLEARPGTLDCGSQNGWFAGGHGDFSVMLDPEKKFLYLFYSNYAGKIEEQGVAVARMAWSDRDSPVGKVLKWYDGGFREPGLGGKLAPAFRTQIDWKREDCDSFWGPSVHWNVYLKQYVLLLNRAQGKGWKQEGIYISFAKDLADPTSWSTPQKIFDGGRWYPCVVGHSDVRGTDKLAGRVARFFMANASEPEIVFSLPA